MIEGATTSLALVDWLTDIPWGTKEGGFLSGYSSFWDDGVLDGMMACVLCETTEEEGVGVRVEPDVEEVPRVREEEREEREDGMRS